MSALSSWVGTKIVRLIGHLVDDQQLGSIFGPDAGFQCFGEDSNTIRRPDVCFVRADRLPIERIGDGYVRVVPDLVVEVISPNDAWDEGEEKIELFHRAGVPLIWVVSPTSRTVRVLRGDGSLSLFREGDELSGEGIIPGFACPVASIFPPRPGPTA